MSDLMDVIYKDTLEKRETDKDSKKENTIDPYDDHVSTLVVANLKIDLIARLVIAAAIFAFLCFNFYELITFIHKQSALPIAQRLNADITSAYIKYSIGINGLVMLIISYWFGAKSGAQNLIKHVMKEKLERYLKSKSL